MRVLTFYGSRADKGLMDIVSAALRKDEYFDVYECQVFGEDVDGAYLEAHRCISMYAPEAVILLGDRFEIIGAALACHLARIPIAHVGGGDVTEGSYDDAMRDCITRMSSIHFVTSTQSEVRVQYLMGQKNVHLVGSPGVDFIMHGDWKKERPIEEPYVVVSYQPETIDDTVDLEVVNGCVAGRKAIWITSNLDRGSNRIPEGKSYPHAEFLNLLYHCDEFIGNSSALYYEAPFLGIKTCEIGKRQKGRVIPFGDGRACERIVKVFKEWKQ